MSASGIVGEGWGLSRSHWRHFVAIAAVVFLVLALITLALGVVLGIAGGLIGPLVSIAGFFGSNARSFLPSRMSETVEPT